MSTAPQSPEQVCTHERRPGTTVCLRCRHAARLEAKLRLKRLMLRGSAVGIVIATFIAAGALGATAIRSKVGDTAAARAAAKAERGVAQQAAAVTPDSAPTDTVSVPAPVVSAVSTPAAAPVAPPVAVATAARPNVRAAAPLAPIVPVGDTPLGDAVVATRGDTDVVVSFDAPMTRTRRPEKFELLVRNTLPAIYGSAVRGILAKIPDGGIAAQGDLFSELPKRGVRIPVASDWALRLIPETRPGQDGPLVVRYRVSVVPTSD